VAWLGHANLPIQTKQTKSERRKMSEEEEQQQKQIDISNLDEIEEEIETSSLYFKPKPGQEYVLRFNPEVNPIDVRETPFKTPECQPVKRYYHKIQHISNGREQLWPTSKTVCLEIIKKLKEGWRVLRVVRTGTDRTTSYTIEGVQKKQQ
jgi:hypothetical protein